MIGLVVAALVAWLGLWQHDAREFHGSFGVTADSLAMGAVAVLLVVIAWRTRQARWSLAALLGYGLVMGVGGALSVLPLPILPFVPEQSLSHYLSHAVYTAAQLPLIVLTLRRLSLRTS